MEAYFEGREYEKRPNTNAIAPSAKVPAAFKARTSPTRLAKDKTFPATKAAQRR